jgi:serine/threonine protein phosphatase 1
VKISAKAVLSAPTMRHISLPDSQRAFVIGDLDSHLMHFKESMDSGGFQPNKDKLICLGDVIDRGADSLAVMGLLQELDALMVLGNHEHMMIESIMSRDEDAKAL